MKIQRIFFQRKKIFQKNILLNYLFIYLFMEKYSRKKKKNSGTNPSKERKTVRFKKIK
jgi:hypothetical protein